MQEKRSQKDAAAVAVKFWLTKAEERGKGKVHPLSFFPSFTHTEFPQLEGTQSIDLLVVVVVCSSFTPTCLYHTPLLSCTPINSFISIVY